MIVTSLQEFYSLFDKTKQILSIDYGTKKTGISISALDFNLAMPMQTIFEISNKKKINEILLLIKKHNIGSVVLGLPINMDGNKTEQTIKVEKFADLLNQEISELAILLYDERLTSRLSDNLLKNTNMKRKQRNKLDDAVAATIILEGVLSYIRLTKTNL